LPFFHLLIHVLRHLAGKPRAIWLCGESLLVGNGPATIAR
jgi:hypothetical protein